MKMDSGTILFIAFMMFFIVGTSIINHYLERRSQEMVNEYQRRFVDPHYYRGIEAGISPERLGELWHQSLNTNADPTIVGCAPGSIFVSLVDVEIEMTSDKSPSVE